MSINPTVQPVQTADPQQLVAQHIGHATNLAKRFKGRGLSIDDLRGEAFVAMSEAAKKFDPALGVPFWGYARFAVKGAMLKAIAQSGRGRMRRLPENYDVADSRPGPGEESAPLPADQIDAVLAHLDADDRELLERRYGVNGHRKHTRAKLAELYGCDVRTINRRLRKAKARAASRNADKS